MQILDQRQRKSLQVAEMRKLPLNACTRGIVVAPRLRELLTKLVPQTAQTALPAIVAFDHRSFNEELFPNCRRRESSWFVLGCGFRVWIC